MQNTGTINQCLQDAYVYTLSLESENILSDIYLYASRVAQKAEAYFLTPQAREYIEGLTEDGINKEIVNFFSSSFSLGNLKTKYNDWTSLESWYGTKENISTWATSLSEPATWDGYGASVAAFFKPKWEFWVGEEARKDMSEMLNVQDAVLSWVNPISWWKATKVWTDVIKAENLGRFKTWGASWFSSNAWKKWTNAVFVKETAK